MTLDPAWSDAVRAARARWPGIMLEEAEFFAHLSGREGVDPTHLEDVYLCVACAKGDSAALRAFEAAYFPELSVVLKKMGAPEGATDELRQLARHHLFVATSGAPKVLAYTGAGSLRKWVRVVMTRMAINALSRRKPETPTEDNVLASLIGGDEKDLELSYIKQLYRDDFKSAFHEAFDRMSEDDQTLLRCAFQRHLSIDAIAVLYDIHRSTAARRVLKVRDELVANLRAALKTRLNVSSDECDSLLRFMRSQLELEL